MIGGSSGDSKNTINVQVYDGGEWSAWTAFTIINGTETTNQQSTQSFKHKGQNVMARQNQTESIEEGIALINDTSDDTSINSITKNLPEMNSIEQGTNILNEIILETNASSMAASTESSLTALQTLDDMAKNGFITG